MPPEMLTLALVTEVFPTAADQPCLVEHLERCRELGAELAVLPELPLNPWSPATAAARDEDAEPPGGERHRRQAEAARAAGVALVGGAIVRDPADGRRYNTALLFDREGALVTSYRKLHLPEEEGFWETAHYEPGDELPRVSTALGFPLGLQLCSDTNRPEGFHLLAAEGAAAILAPRATPLSSYDRWRLVLRANAVTSAAYVVSVNRPRPEQGVPLGGASIAVAPDGEVLVETTEAVATVTCDAAAVARGREDYPGYLPVRAELWARGYRRLAERQTG